MNDGELTGQARTHIAAVADPPCQLHAQVVAPFLNLRRAAQADGFDLAPVSSFRDFARQLEIWNGKFSGERPMLGASGAQLDAAALRPRERIDAILLWSALPGASRHHWGTDLDLVDRALRRRGLSGQTDARGVRARRAVCEARPLARPCMRRASDSFVPFRACAPACSPNPGISALRRSRKKPDSA